jgi:bifunctional oligoribonuclease and PAP phosphatase NrnA
VTPFSDGSGIDAETLAAAARAVASLPRDASVLLACHVNPDGDAIGSMLGFGLGLRKLGFTNVTASFPEPYDVAEPFKFLPGLDLLVAPGRAPARPDLGISFDAASPLRLGSLTGPLGAAPVWIVLDHHMSNTGFGTLRLVDPAAAATAVVAAQLLDALDAPYDKEMATCLYVGLATDTGSFKFYATTPEVLALASRLVAAGADPAEVAGHVFDRRPFAAIRLLAEVLTRAELDPEAAGGRGLVSAYATSGDLAAHGQPSYVLESFMDIVRTAAEADVACLVKPAGPGEWSVSLRSKGATDVSGVAVALGGGGHRLAAGFTGYGTAEEVLAAVRHGLDPRDESQGGAGVGNGARERRQE